MDDAQTAMTRKKTFVGGYTLGERGEGLRIAFTRKPSWWHRFWMRVALDVRWDDRIETIDILTMESHVG